MKEETKENNYRIHDAIISWACIFWAIVSIALMCYFTGMNQVTFSIMTFGQLFIVMGIISFVKRQAIMGGVFTVTGIGSIIIPAINIGINNIPIKIQPFKYLIVPAGININNEIIIIPSINFIIA